MRELVLTDDELVVLALEVDQALEVALPTVGRSSEEVAAAATRGGRSFLVRSGEVAPDRWAQVLEDARRLVRSSPAMLLCVANGWEPSSGAVLTSVSHDDGLSTLDVVDLTGLHRGVVGDPEEVGDLVRQAVADAWSRPPVVPEDWPRQAPAPDGLLLRAGVEQVRVGVGSAVVRRSGELLGETLDRAGLDAWVDARLSSCGDDG